MTTQPTCAVCSKPLADGATVCTADARDLAQRLREAAGHADDAWTVIARQARYGSGGSARQLDSEPLATAERHARNAVTEFGWAASIERPLAGGLRPGILPPDLAASGRLADITTAVTTWARHVCEQRGVELPARRPLLGPLCDRGFECPHASCMGIRFRRPPSNLAEACGWLATQVDWLRMRPEVAEAFRVLGEACADLERMVDRPRSGDRLVGMCDCGKILYAPYARDVVQCKACGQAWNVTESQEILLGHLDGQLVTVSEALDMAGWLDTERSREQIRNLINGWLRRGQLAAHGHILRDPTDAELRDNPAAGPVQAPTYRFGEIRQRLAETPRRQRDGAAARPTT